MKVKELDDTSRESGYYWIMSSVTSDWTPAEWVSHGGYWMLIGTECLVYDDEITIVGDKIDRIRK